MSQMKKLLIRLTKKLFSDLPTTMIAVVLASSPLALLGKYIFSEMIWNAIIETMLLPSPLWAPIALALLLVLYIFLKASKDYSSNKSIFICDSDLKWKVTIHLR